MLSTPRSPLCADSSALPSSCSSAACRDTATTRWLNALRCLLIVRPTGCVTTHILDDDGIREGVRWRRLSLEAALLAAQEHISNRRPLHASHSLRAGSMQGPGHDDDDANAKNAKAQRDPLLRCPPGGRVCVQGGPRVYQYGRCVLPSHLPARRYFSCTPSASP